MDALQRLAAWKLAVTDRALKQELDTMDEPTAKERFGSMLEFGTGGMRGVLGAGLDRMNVYTVGRATRGYVDYLQRYGEDAKHRGVVIAHDNRHMSREFALRAAGVLAAGGCRAFLFDSLRPTPELSFAVRHLNCFGGIVITASHNPPEYNGFKLYDQNGCQLVPEFADEVIRCVELVPDELNVPCLTPDQAGDLIGYVGQEVDEAYYQEVIKIQLTPQVDKSALKVVYSPQHGAANVAVRTVLGRIGYQVTPVESQCTPDPDFSNTKNANPEDPAAFEAGIAIADEIAADIVICTDPDGDRLGVAVRHQGEFVFMTGNQTGAVLMDYIFSRRRELGQLHKDGVMINTVVTSDLGDVIARHYGLKVEKTLTGFKFIGDLIQKHQLAGDAHFEFGYEESYGYLIQPFVRDKDSVQACVMICELAAILKNQGKTLVDALNDVFDRFGYYQEGQLSITLKGSDGAKRIAAIMARYREQVPEALGGIPVVAAEDYLTGIRTQGGTKTKLDFIPSDVLKFMLADGSWVAIRPSGTEPKCKFYFCACADSLAAAKTKLADLREHFNREQ